MDGGPDEGHGTIVAHDEEPGIGELLASEKRGIGELLATVAGTVAAVPVVLGFVALGGVVLASRAVLGVTGVLRDGRGRRRKTPRLPPASTP